MEVGDLVEYNCDHGVGIGIIVSKGLWYGQFNVVLNNGMQVLLHHGLLTPVKKCP